MGASLLLAAAFAWTSPPDASACAAWCKWDEANCVAPNKREQCRGCDRCAAVIKAAEAKAVAEEAAAKAAVCARPSGHPNDSAQKGCEWWCAPADRAYDCRLCRCQKCDFCGGTQPAAPPAGGSGSERGDEAARRGKGRGEGLGREGGEGAALAEQQGERTDASSSHHATKSHADADDLPSSAAPDGAANRSVAEESEAGALHPPHGGHAPRHVGSKAPFGREDAREGDTLLADAATEREPKREAVYFRGDQELSGAIGAASLAPQRSHHIPSGGAVSLSVRLVAPLVSAIASLPDHHSTPCCASPHMLSPLAPRTSSRQPAFVWQVLIILTLGVIATGLRLRRQSRADSAPQLGLLPRCENRRKHRRCRQSPFAARMRAHRLQCLETCEEEEEEEDATDL